MEIGIVDIRYNAEGKVTDGTFTPTLRAAVDKKLINQLFSIEKPADEAALRANSELILADWFTRLNDIELADRELYEVKGEVLGCDKYPDGRVQHCRIVFNFVKR